MNVSAPNWSALPCMPAASWLYTPACYYMCVGRDTHQSAGLCELGQWYETARRCSQGHFL